ncbi:MAG: hypothetical protein U0V02_13035 [Anaerolineales bacterium]
MNTLIILSLSILVFILILYAETSANQYIRQKFTFAYFVVAIIEIIAGFNIYEGRIEHSIFIYSFVGVFPLPFIIARIINSFRLKDKSFHFTLHTQLKKHAILLIVPWLFLIGGNLFEQKELLINDFENLIEYFIYSYGISLLAIANIIFILLHTLQIVKIYEEGFTFDGFLWKWSDFHSYLITSDTNNQKFQKVTLNLAKKIWIPIYDIDLSITTENEERLNAWLSQRLPHI